MKFTISCLLTLEMLQTNLVKIDQVVLKKMFTDDGWRRKVTHSDRLPEWLRWPKNYSIVWPICRNCMSKNIQPQLRNALKLNKNWSWELKLTKQMSLLIFIQSIQKLFGRVPFYFSTTQRRFWWQKIVNLKKFDEQILPSLRKKGFPNNLKFELIVDIFFRVHRLYFWFFANLTTWYTT